MFKEFLHRISRKSDSLIAYTMKQTNGQRDVST